MYAAKSGNTDKVRILLEHGADINTKDNNGKLYKFISVYMIHINAP